MVDAARKAAAQLLLRQRLYSLFIDVTKLKYDKKVIFASLQDFCRSTSMTMADIAGEKDLRDGCTLVRKIKGKNRYIVLFNTQQKNLRRRSFTLAHEIGHIYLGHLDDGNENEAQANSFASELLMPESLLWAYLRMNGGKADIHALCSIFNISRSAAEFRIRQCNKEPCKDEDSMILEKFTGLFPSHSGPIVTVG